MARSGSCERLPDADDSSAAQPAPVDSLASATTDHEDTHCMEVSPQDSVLDDESDSDADLHVVMYGQWAFFRKHQTSRNGAEQLIIDECRILHLGVPVGRWFDKFNAKLKRLRSNQLAEPKKINAVSQNTAALFPSVLSSESLILIVRYVAAHNWEIIWHCSECNPYWYDWYCDKCRQVNKILPWSKRTHFGCVMGTYCGCCRSAEKQELPCNACDDLRSLKVTCHTMRDLLKTYSGT